MQFCLRLALVHTWMLQTLTLLLHAGTPHLHMMLEAEEVRGPPRVTQTCSM